MVEPGPRTMGLLNVVSAVITRLVPPPGELVVVSAVVMVVVDGTVAVVEEVVSLVTIVEAEGVVVVDF